MTRAVRVWRWVARRPFLASLVVMGALVAPGYFRQEQTIRDAQRTADQVAEIQADEEAERITRAVEACDRVVAVRVDNRAMWLFLFDLLAGGELVPVVAAELDVRLPALECDAEHVPVPIND